MSRPLAAIAEGTNYDDFVKRIAQEVSSGSPNVALQIIEATNFGDITSSVKTPKIITNEAMALNDIIKLGNEEVVKALIAKGFNPNYKDESGMDGLCTAAEQGNCGMVQALFQTSKINNFQNPHLIGFVVYLIDTLFVKDIKLENFMPYKIISQDLKNLNLQSSTSIFALKLFENKEPLQLLLPLYMKERSTERAYVGASIMTFSESLTTLK